MKERKANGKREQWSVAEDKEDEKAQNRKECKQQNNLDPEDFDPNWSVGNGEEGRAVAAKVSEWGNCSTWRTKQETKWKECGGKGTSKGKKRRRKRTKQWKTGEVEKRRLSIMYKSWSIRKCGRKKKKAKSPRQWNWAIAMDEKENAWEVGVKVWGTLSFYEQACIKWNI